MDSQRKRSRLDDQPGRDVIYVRMEPMESAMGGAGDISGGMAGGAGGDVGEMAEAGLIPGVDPRSAIGLPPLRPVQPQPRPEDERMAG